MRTARSVDEVAREPRAVAIGSFDGVHIGHRRVIEAIVAAGPAPTVITFDPHPRAALGEGVGLLTTPERRLELLAALGVEDVLLLAFDAELAGLDAEGFVDAILRPIGTEVVAAGASFRFGSDRAGDPALLQELGFEIRRVPTVPGVSSSAIRALVAAGEVQAAARSLGGPPELEGVVVAGDARGMRLGFPTANVDVDPRLLLPADGIYAGAADGHRAAISIGTNPHYGGTEWRAEAFLLDFEGDLYGQRLRLELWRRLRGAQAFESEEALVAQIARDVEETRAASRPQ
jgi:riboflavin kinase / FMN adenylyltransferase